MTLPAAMQVGRAALARERGFLSCCALLFAASAAATVAWCGSMSGGMAMPGGWTMSMAWMRMPGQSWLGAGAMFLGMWIMMMVAMMLPSLVPMLSSYRHSVRGPARARRDGLTALVGLAYFFVWSLCGVAAYLAGLAVAGAAMRWPAASARVPAATGVLFLLVGLVQLTRWKARLLGRCRGAPRRDLPAGEPSVRAEARFALRHGMRLGLHCSLCSSGFTSLLLATGVMNLGPMALAAAAITVERLAPGPARAARATGFGALAAGALILTHILRIP